MKCKKCGGNVVDIIEKQQIKKAGERFEEERKHIILL